MSVLQTIDLKKYYGTEPNITRALDGVNFSVNDGEFVAVVGTSGSGKSTLLHMMGGLDTPTSGTVIVRGEELAKKNDEQLTIFRRRNIGFIFQNYNLVPILNVYENIVLPVELDGDTVDQKFLDEIVHLLGLEDKLKNMPNNLSGGQQQRVAIARALVTSPEIICLDEPLSNLDAKLRIQLRNELKDLQRKFGITTVYVTHDQEEALTLSNRIAVFNKGVIEQIGRPDEIYNHSATEFVCNFIGDINYLKEEFLRSAGCNLCAGVDLSRHCYIRLERMHVNGEVGGDAFKIEATVKNMEYYGLYIKYTLEAGGQQIKVIEKNSGKPLYDAGKKVTVSFRPEDIMQYEG